MVHTDTIEKLLGVLRHSQKRQTRQSPFCLKRFNGDLRVLLVRKADNPADPWSGQIALPGGKSDAKDQDLAQTVAREIMEETNINVFDRCRFLGTPAVQRSKPRPEMRILPFVILVQHEPTIKLSKQEMVSYLWVGSKKYRGIKAPSSSTVGALTPTSSRLPIS